MSTGDHWKFYTNDIGQQVCRNCGRLACEHQGVSFYGVLGGAFFPDPPLWTMTTNAGWECPRCHRIYGPQVTECEHCNEEE